MKITIGFFLFFVLIYCSRGLGGKLGVEVMEKLNVQTMKELSEVNISKLRKKFGENTG